MIKYSPEELSRCFAALADPTRRGIVDRLSYGPASVSTLAAPLPISLPAVVQHLAVLQQSGLIETHKIGRVRTCQLRVDQLAAVEDWLHERRRFWQRNLDRLGTLLDQPQQRHEGESNV